MSSLSEQQWIWLRDELARRFGLFLDESRQNQGCSVVKRLAQAHGLSVDTFYARLLRPEGRSDLYALAEELANHETQFLRNPAQFRALREVLFPELTRLRPLTRSLRCWSAGCSTGEEPYGIAMTALLTFGFPLSRKVEVWGTDLSSHVIQRARQGIYSGRTLTNIQADYKQWFDTYDSRMLRVSSSVRSLVQFEQHNLLDPWPVWANNLDIIFCQNVTIYFQLETCKRLIAQMYASLAPGGYLLLGFSESLWGIFDRFETVELDGAFVYRKSDVPVSASSQVVQQRQQKLEQSEAAKSNWSWPIRRKTYAPTPKHAEPKESAASLIQRAQELRSVGQQRSALQLLAKIRPDQRDPSLLALIAQLHADLGEPEQAAAEARRALELDVMQDTAYVVLGVLEVQNGAWKEGAQLLERAQYLNPDAPVVSFYLAESYRHQGRLLDARREYRNAMRKLRHLEKGALIDGVAVGWLIETCQRWLDILEKQNRDA